MSDPAGGAPSGDEEPVVSDTRRDAQRPSSSPSAGPDPAAVFQSHVRAARTQVENQVAHARAEFEEANERIKQRTGRDLILAIIIALAIGAVVIGSLIFFKWLFVPFALAACSLGIFEFSRALIGAGRRVDVVLQVVVGALLMTSGFFLPLGLHWVVTFAAVAIVIVWRCAAQMAARDGRLYADVGRDVLVAGWIQFYVAFLGSLCAILLRQDGGEWWVLAFVAVVVAADTGAYAAGLMFGRHPMAPRISPKKTWEGFAGAAIAALVAGVLLAILMLGLPAWAGLVFGALILGTATVGDLGESMIKRDLGIKDMSSWLPGHGGVLDRLDSILPSTVVALALFFVFSPLGVS